MRNAKDKIPTKRGIIITFLFSLFIPGLGHLYCGRTKKAVIFFFLRFIFCTYIFQQFIMQYFYMNLLVEIMHLIIWIYIILDSIIIAKNEKEYILKPYNRWYYYLLILIFYILLFVVTGSRFGSKYLSIKKFKLITTHGNSMYPTLREGDEVLYEYKTFVSDEIERGTIVSFESREGFWKPFIQDINISSFHKRVIGLPGEIFELKNGYIYINNVKLHETWTYLEVADSNIIQDSSNFITLSEERRTSDENYGIPIKPIIITANKFVPINIRPIIIPDNKFYLLGDNLLKSYDSRIFGFIDIKHIKGKALYIYRPIKRIKKLNPPNDCN